MGFFKSIKKGIVSKHNVKNWAGGDQIKQSASLIGRLCSSLFSKKKVKIHNETFEEATKRMNLSETDIQNRMKSLKKTYRIYGYVCLMLFFYLIYLLFNAHYAASFTALMLVLIAGLFAVKSNFQYFQMSKRKLGCSFKEWFACLLER